MLKEPCGVRNEKLENITLGEILLPKSPKNFQLKDESCRDLHRFF